ncbi:hypothetical protein BJ085DRAFT_28958 [Dimargaris cristalligena]|uniref:F-box domain-containing protein n=1 Tax=Dimargaris cristalligena TaxID=215637 RepID=A0A4P9ZQD5_9FUNG|nr:hypothetical protein BJ085DRAFT_28958 [Dimargaris cristalligena]|eukprot:RKP35613.1 hypothetical protein BJ085DRAFT_28958 [Dimargaris cristalligena]
MRAPLASVTVLGLAMALYVASRPQPSATGPRTIDPTPETEAGDNAIWYDARSGNFNDEAWDNSEVDDHATDATHSSDTHGGIVSQSESDIEQPPAEHSKPTHKNLPLKYYINQLPFELKSKIVGYLPAEETIDVLSIGEYGRGLVGVYPSAILLSPMHEQTF